MDVALEFSGLEKIASGLADLKGRKLGTLQRKAINAGTQVIAKEIKERAKQVADTHTLERSIGKKVTIFRGSGVAVGIAGPRTRFRKEFASKTGKLFRREPSRTLHIVEHGSRRSRAKPVVGPAVAAKADAAQAAMVDKAREVLESL